MQSILNFLFLKTILHKVPKKNSSPHFFLASKKTSLINFCITSFCSSIAGKILASIPLKDNLNSEISKVK